MTEFEVLIGGMVALVAVVAGLIVLMRQAQKLPGPAQLYVEALEPYVWKAIAVAFKASDYAVDVFGHRLEGVNRAALADRVYDLIPALIEFKGVTIPIKELCSREQFSQAVRYAYDQMVQTYMQGQAGWEDAVIELLKQQGVPVDMAPAIAPDPVAGQ